MSLRSARDVTDRDIETSSPGGSDARLVEEARRGSQEAFGELVKRYERRLFRVLYRFVRDEEIAEDLVQETFLRTYERLDQFDPSRRFGPWLFRIGVNLALDLLRRQRRRVKWWLFSDSPADRPPEPVQDDPRKSIDLKQEVDAVLARLPESYRTVLVLRDLENFTTSEIAAILNRKEPTIRWRLAEARQRFQKLWTQRTGASLPHASDDETTGHGQDGIEDELQAGAD